MDEWLTDACDRIAAASGLSRSDLDLDEADMTTLLDLARLAAHESGARTNAPLLCYILGRASGQAELGTLAEALRGE